MLRFDRSGGWLPLGDSPSADSLPFEAITKSVSVSMKSQDKRRERNARGIVLLYR